MLELERRIREVPVEEAKEYLEPMLRLIEASIAEGTEVRRAVYFRAILYSAKLLLTKIEEKGDYTRELWDSYLRFIKDCIYSYGTRDMQVLIAHLEDIVKAVMSFPNEPSCLLEDYQYCVAAQRAQYQLGAEKLPQNASAQRLASGSSPSLSGREPVSAVGELLEAPPQPDLERDAPLGAVVPTIAVEELHQILSELPPRMTFAHTNGILHVKLTNPLAIPAAPYVATGYSCDTCKLQGIHVAYQAMLYDSEAPTATGDDEGDHARSGLPSSSRSASSQTSGEVRSAAEIIRKSFVGFDVCTACAVYFLHTQKQNVWHCLREPHAAYALGRASGVEVQAATYHLCDSRRRHVRLRRASSCTELADDMDEDALCTCLDSCPHLRAGWSVSEVAPPYVADLGRHARRRSDPAVPPMRVSPPRAQSACDGVRLMNGPRSPRHARSAVAPPTRPPRWFLRSVASRSGRRRGSSGSSSSGLVSARARTLRCVRLTVTIAPYGARPIAWVLPHPKAAAAAAAAAVAVDEPCADGGGGRLSGVLPTAPSLHPPRDWRSRCDIRSQLAYTRPGSAAATGVAREAVSSSPRAGATGDGPALPPPGTIAPSTRVAWTPPPMASTEVAGMSGPARALSPSLAAPPLRADPLSHSELSGWMSGSESAPVLTTDSAADVCAICLSSLGGDVPVIQTTCHHFFHVRCIEPHARLNQDDCPLCRHPHALPDMSRATTLERNAFHLTLLLSEEEGSRERVTICVGALITGSGLYENPTSMAAARCVTLVRPLSRSPSPASVPVPPLRASGFQQKASERHSFGAEGSGGVSSSRSRSDQERRARVGFQD